MDTPLAKPPLATPTSTTAHAAHRAASTPASGFFVARGYEYTRCAQTRGKGL
jgi:hypothetical protein